MAYLKYKELTKYFYFYKELEIEGLPKYVLDYVHKNEKIIRAYSTKRDKSIFTTEKIVLFDISAVVNAKKIHVIPYKFITSLSLQFEYNDACLLLYLVSGYPVNIKYKNLDDSSKTRLRELYTIISDKVVGFD